MITKTLFSNLQNSQLYLHVHVCMCNVHVCMCNVHARMCNVHARMCNLQVRMCNVHVRMWNVCLPVCLHACMHSSVCVYVCICICMYVCWKYSNSLLIVPVWIQGVKMVQDGNFGVREKFTAFPWEVAKWPLWRAAEIDYINLLEKLASSYKKNKEDLNQAHYNTGNYIAINNRTHT